MKFKDLRIGMEVYFIDPCLDIILTKIVSLGNDSFGMGGCSKPYSNKYDAKHLHLTANEAAKPITDKLIREKYNIQAKINRLIARTINPIDYRKYKE